VEREKNLKNTPFFILTESIFSATITMIGKIFSKE